MSNITADDVRRLARLARLELSEDEVPLFAEQLGTILAFARQLQAAPGSELESVVTDSSSDPGDSAGCGGLREDVVQPSLDPADVLRGAPLTDATDCLFKVPRVLGG